MFLQTLIFLVLLIIMLFGLNILIKLIRFLFFRNEKTNLGDYLVEIVFEFGKRANDKALIGIIEEAKKLISENPHLLTLSSVWVDIIDYIREAQSKEAQLAFFKYIFKKAKFPNSEKLAVYLVEIINIRWFNPHSKPDKKTLEALASNCIKEFSLYTFNEDGRTKSYQIEGTEFIEDDWAKALSAESNLVPSPDIFKSGEDKETIQKSKKGEYLEAIQDIIFGVIWSANPAGTSSDNSYLKSAVGMVEQLAKLIILEDLIKEKKNNIFSSLLEIYKLGAWPIGVIENSNMVYKFIVFIPPSVKEKNNDLSETPLFITKILLANKKMSQSLGGDIKEHLPRFKWFVRPN